MEFIKLAPRHEGVVHDIAFDYYGNVIDYCINYYLKSFMFIMLLKVSVLVHVGLIEK